MTELFKIEEIEVDETVCQCSFDVRICRNTEKIIIEDLENDEIVCQCNFNVRFRCGAWLFSFTTERNL